MKINKYIGKCYKFVIGARGSGKSYFMKNYYLKKVPNVSKKLFKKFINGKMVKEDFLHLISNLIECVFDVMEVQFDEID